MNGLPSTWSNGSIDAGTRKRSLMYDMVECHLALHTSRLADHGELQQGLRNPSLLVLNGRRRQKHWEPGGCDLVIYLNAVYAQSPAGEAVFWADAVRQLQVQACSGDQQQLLWNVVYYAHIHSCKLDRQEKSLFVGLHCTPCAAVFACCTQISRFR